MDVLIKDADMAVDSSGTPLYTEGAEEMLQRVCFALKTEKGRFIYNRNLGVEKFKGELDSRGIKRLEARCREAVMNIEGIELCVDRAEKHDESRIRMQISVWYQGEEYKREVII